ncbi:hypothetical protein ymoll0001_20180 [Yersinia mollaretii ATCC 43969]|uniref:Uncharacterized protein n=1 Tax=Yersinia mollaretii (strain ATCC 43969 / DSM 18520 / CIP 103324 / CNY 7263 / WAIP 204) TaxID=349967 RepID=A0ABM9YC48_YERMW|nr:hypothetical protein ymoll0001_20180 [Yersinia mollaretii ATCC 43969]
MFFIRSADNAAPLFIRNHFGYTGDVRADRTIFLFIGVYASIKIGELITFSG